MVRVCKRLVSCLVLCLHCCPTLGTLPFLFSRNRDLFRRRDVIWDAGRDRKCFQAKERTSHQCGGKKETRAGTGSRV